MEVMGSFGWRMAENFDSGPSLIWFHKWPFGKAQGAKQLARKLNSSQVVLRCHKFIGDQAKFFFSVHE